MKTRSFLWLILTLTSVLASPYNVNAGDFPKGSPKFVSSYQKALSDAKETGKPIIVIFSASWCPPCQAMKKEVYPSEVVKPFHDKFIWAYLDADDSQNAKAMEKFGAEGIPHIEFLNTAEESISKQVGGCEPNDFATELESLLAKINSAPKTKP